jgi:L-threonylcarbamoyladenylate synthase
VAELSRGGKRIGVLAQRSPLGSFRHVTWVNAGTRVDSYAHDLYSNLRTLDRAGASHLLVQEVPKEERWDAVRDRLTRAAAATPREFGDLP